MRSGWVHSVTIYYLLHAPGTVCVSGRTVKGTDVVLPSRSHSVMELDQESHSPSPVCSSARGACSFQHDLSMSLCCNSPQARASEKASTFAHQPDTGLLQAHRCWHFPQCGWRCPHTGGRSEPHTCPPSRLRHSGSAGRRSEARPHLLTQSSQRSLLGAYALHHSCGYGPLATGPATSVSGWR